MKRFAVLVFTFMSVAGGVWLLGRPVGPGVENGAHQQAVRQLLAPAGGPLWRLPEVVEHVAAEPVFVDLLALPAASYSGITAEEEEEGGILGAEVTEALQAEALKQRMDRNVQLIGSGSAAPTPGSTHFAGPDFTQCCGGFGGITPPDPEMAAGPDHLIVVVNLAFVIYDKSGSALLGPLSFTSLFGSQPACTSGLFDPVVVYDGMADRFILTIDAEGSFFCVAAAQNSDPLAGVWAVYVFDANGTGNLFFDFPQVGIGRDALYMSGNLFDLTTTPPSYVSSRLWAFDKASLYSGTKVEVSERSAGSFFTPQPLYLHGDFPADGPHYFLGMQDFNNGSHYGLIAWDEPFDSNRVSYRYVNLNEVAGVPNYPVSAPQLGGQNIQANDWRPLDFEYDNGDGWMSQTVSCNPGGGVVNCVRWAQIELATGAVRQAGLLAGGNAHRIFPDLAVNKCGDMAIGYTKTSSQSYPGIWYSGRQAGDRANQLQDEAELKGGELPYVTTIVTDQPPYRWGDYTGMTIDPDGETFWYVGEYSKNTNTLDGRWGTYIGSFSYPCPAEPVEFSSFVYLPFTGKSSFLPKAGYWRALPSHDFYVRPDQAAVLNYGIAFSIPGCDDFKVILPGPFPIVNNRFAFESVLYASGVFGSETSASGFDGITNLYIAQCDVTITAGPFAWNAGWENDDQPIPTAQIVDDPLVEGITPDAAGLIVIPIERGD